MTRSNAKSEDGVTAPPDGAILDLLCRQLPVTVWTTDASLAILSARGSVKETLGAAAESLQGRCLTDLFDHKDPRVQVCRQALKAGRTARSTLTAGNRIFSLSASPHGGTESPCCVTVALDITRQSRAERELASTAAQYRDFIDNAHDLIFTLDLSGRFTTVNAAINSLLGYSEQEALSMRLADLLAPEFRATLANRLAHPDGSMQSETWEAPALSRGGARVHLEFRSRCIPATTDRPASIEVIARDVTERRNLEDHVRQAQKMEAIGVLAGGIAHDFNNLLTGILGYGYLLQNDPEIQESHGEAVDVILRSAERASQLTTQLLGFARRNKSQSVPVDVHNVIRDLMALLQRTIDKKIRISAALRAEHAFVMGDAGQLYQVLLNLCLNARDAMPRGGDLTIQTRITGDVLAITVTDTGSGIPAEIRERIFEPFFTTKTPDKGTGMGLAVVYGIVRSHGGTVLVESAPDRGSSFEVSLPLSPTMGDGVSTKASKPRAGRGRILVIDDEEIVRQVLSRMLRSLGYDVATAGDSVHAVEYYRRHYDQIDAVILDMVMPKMGGRECYQALKEINPAIRAVLSSGYSPDNEAGELVVEAGLEFLQKPYQLDQLATAVRKALGRRAASGQQTS